jgi:hypothetical protein
VPFVNENLHAPTLHLRFDLEALRLSFDAQALIIR